MRIALVHDWLTSVRGGERVFALLSELYPHADLFTLVHQPGSMPPELERRGIRTSWLQRMPWGVTHYRYYFPLLPLAAESLDLSDYDLVISSSSAVVKGVLTRPEALHISYVHSPMRYIWDLAPDYFPRSKWRNRLFAPALLAWMRSWDVTSSKRVDRFVANSQFVARRIRKYYRRSSSVIHPPIDCGFFEGTLGGGAHYLMVSALVENKGVELAVEAFTRSGRALRIVGEGPMLRSLRQAAGPNIEFLGRIGESQLRQEYLDCRALVHCAVEDFGMAPLEAAAAGRATIALAQGGSLETIRALGPDVGDDSATGVLFYQRTPQALQEAIHRFELAKDAFKTDVLRAHAHTFDREVAALRLREYVAQAWRAHKGLEAETGLPSELATEPQSVLNQATTPEPLEVVGPC